MAADAHGAHLYAIHEVGSATASSFLREKDGSLRLLNEESTHGAGACHVSMAKDGQSLLTANYSSGSFSSIGIAKDGALGPLVWTFQNSGKGADPGRQSEPHAHSLYDDPRGRFSAGCDLGTDEVLVFRPSQPVVRINAVPGSGPRHLAFSKDGKFAYVGGELSSTVQVFGIKSATEWHSIQSISTLPPDWHQPSYVAEVAMHPSGNWLYVSNRGHDSITIYQVLPSGTLKAIDHHRLTEKFPRGFAIEPSGHWLIVAGQNSDNVEALSIDPATGLLTSKQMPTAIQSPVSILILPQSR